MTPTFQVAETASSFWDDAGLPDAYPRDVRRAVVLTQPLSLVLLSELHVSGVLEWLRRQGRNLDMAVRDRPLRACLVARSGAGFIFVDGGDQESEQRYSIAHELAHFLLDYVAPRQEAVSRLGDEILDVLDGLRPETIAERAGALLTGVGAGAHVHLLGRSEEEAAAETIDIAEARADALALELLAPWADVSTQIGAQGIGVERAAIVRLLTDHYGLPPVPARRYAARFLPQRESSSALLRHLRATPRTSLPASGLRSSGGPR